MTLLLTLDDGSTQRKLADAVDYARAAVLEGAPEGQVGDHVGAHREDAVTLSHLFEAQVPGYHGWRWSVTVALAGEDEPVTVSEVVLVPGPEALVAPAWVPWEQRVRAGDLGVGDIFPTDKDDPRLAPAYLQSDDPAVEEVALEVGLGRVHVLSRFGREDAASRWHAGEFGPRSDMARSAPDVCGTCGFFVPLAGSLRGTFGACTNDIAPADGHVVDVAYGCGAHSEIEVEVTSSVPVAELVYDDSLLDFAAAPEPEAPQDVAELPGAEVGAAQDVAELPVAVEVEPEVAEPEPTQDVAELPEPAEAEVPEAVTEDAVVAEVEEPAAVEEPQVEADEAQAQPVAETSEGPAADEAVTEPEAPQDAAELPGAEVGAAQVVAELPEAGVEVPQDVAELPEAGEVEEPAVPEPEPEPTQAEVTDAVVVEEPRAEPDEAQAQVDTTAEAAGDQRDA